MSTREIIKDYILKECDESVRLEFEKDNNIDLLSGNILDSLGIVRFLVFVEDKFSVDLVDDDIELEDFVTLNRISELIDKKVAQAKK